MSKWTITTNSSSSSGGWITYTGSGITSTSPAKGADAIILPDKGETDGNIRLQSADGDDLISINSDKTITILGKNFDLQRVADALENFCTDRCSCNMNTLMSTGCQCGGK